MYTMYRQYINMRIMQHMLQMKTNYWYAKQNYGQSVAAAMLNIHWTPSV